MLSKNSRKFSTTPLGCALVPEVNRITASSSGPAGRSGSLGGNAQARRTTSPVPAVETTEPQPWRRGLGQQIVELQAVLIENELRLEPFEDIAELIAIHLDVNGANGRARGHDAEIAEQLLDGIVGEKRDAVVRSKAALAQEGGEAADRLAQSGRSLPFAHHPPI